MISNNKIPSNITMVKLKNWRQRLRKKLIPQSQSALSSMIISRKWKMWANKNLSMNLNWWPGSRIAPVLRRPSRRRGIELKLNKQGWRDRKKLSLSPSYNISSSKQNKMHKGIFKRSREASTTRTKNWLRRQCLKDTPLTTTREKRRSWINNKKIWAETSSSRKELPINMSREGITKPKRWRT